MKKLLSALLVAALLVASVACMFAVSAEEDAVVYNYLAEMKDADTDTYTVKANEDGSVTVTFKADLTSTATLMLTASTDWTFDATKQYYFVADVENTEGVNFVMHYTRADKAADGKVADLFWSSMNNETDYGTYIALKKDSAAAWDITKYLGSAEKYQFNDHIHAFTTLEITDAKAGEAITFNTLALVTDTKAVTPGTPLVKPAAGTETSSEEPATSSEEPATSSEEPAASSEAPAASSEAPAASSTAPATSSTSKPTTGDAGMIVFAVLAVVAVAGAVAAVRVRH